MIFDLSLPYPPSANRYWRNFNGRMVKSPIASAFVLEVKRAAMAKRVTCAQGPIELTWWLHPKTTKTGRASKVVLDLSNSLKIVEDALQGVCYVNDSQVVAVNGRYGNPLPDGGLSIRVRVL